MTHLSRHVLGPSKSVFVATCFVYVGSFSMLLVLETMLVDARDRPGVKWSDPLIPGRLCAVAQMQQLQP